MVVLDRGAVDASLDKAAGPGPSRCHLPLGFAVGIDGAAGGDRSVLLGFRFIGRPVDRGRTTGAPCAVAVTGRGRPVGGGGGAVR